ncbi:MAG TPA: phosphatase PAP2 family protein, partial [Chloroflexota bacterium]
SVPASSRVWPSAWQWVLFAMQVVIVAMVEVGDDVIRGNFWRPDTREALGHARDVATFEASHGFFVEPRLQYFFEQTHHLFGITLTWAAITDVVDDVYAFCHIVVTLAVVLWIFVDHRPRFALVRNITFLTNALALIGYELYPMAPPRLTSGLVYAGHAVHFRDTMRHVLGTGTLNGTPIAYNPFSAMPSLHVAWALIVGASLLLMAHHPLVKLLGVVYPTLMTFTVVVTANHYLMDAVGAAIAVAGGTLIALSVQAVFDRLRPAPVPAPAYVQTADTP